MKKIVLTLAVIIGLGTMSINAQDVDVSHKDKKISFGVKAEANLSNHFMSSNLRDDYKSKLGFGATVGGFAKFDLHPNIAIQPEVLVHYKTSKLEHKTSKLESDFEYWGMEIPIYGMGQMNLWNGRGYVALGPYVGLGFSAELGDVKQYDNYDGHKDNEMYRWDLGGAAMVGYEFNFGLQINASYKMGFTNNLNRLNDSHKMRNQMLSLGLAYRF